jgi:glutathione synthase/RimK-type ligase-like ATP-grasp enzyme
VAAVALATCAEQPEGDEDAPALRAALAALGVRAVPAVWDDPGVDWGAFALVVVRSTFDYVERREAFLAWADRVPRLWNPAPVLRWNTDKAYLADLAAAGVPTVPSVLVGPGDPLPTWPSGEWVVKPAVGVGARGAARFGPGDEAAAAERLARLTAAGGRAVVQPFLAGVDQGGETDVIVVDGAVSHAVTKGPVLARDDPDPDGPYRPPAISPRTPTAEERALALAALAAVPGPDLLYARVDLLPGPDGPLVSEVEVTEPFLFLAEGEGTAERLAAAVVRRLGG